MNLGSLHKQALHKQLYPREYTLRYWMAKLPELPDGVSKVMQRIDIRYNTLIDSVENIYLNGWHLKRFDDDHIRKLCSILIAKLNGIDHRDCIGNRITRVKVNV